MIWIELFKLFNKFCLLAYCAHPGPLQIDRRSCDCLASSVPFTNIQAYLLTYLLIRCKDSEWIDRIRIDTLPLYTDKISKNHKIV